MEWKEFLKPNKSKIIVFIIVILLAFIATRQFLRTLEFDSNPCDTYTADVGYYLPLYLPVTLVDGIYNTIYCKDFMCDSHSMCKRIPSYLYYFEFILEFIYLYLISCLIIFIYTKIKYSFNKK